MSKKKKLPNVDNYVKKYLRRASLYWPGRAEALRLAKVAPGRWKCAECGKICKKGEYNLDHIIPVIPLDGKIMRDNDRKRLDLNKYVDRMLVSAEGWAVLCIQSHEIKTQKENAMREFYKKSKK